MDNKTTTTTQLVNPVRLPEIRGWHRDGSRLTLIAFGDSPGNSPAALCIDWASGKFRLESIEEVRVEDYRYTNVGTGTASTQRDFAKT